MQHGASQSQHEYTRSRVRGHWLTMTIIMTMTMTMSMSTLHCAQACTRIDSPVAPSTVQLQPAEKRKRRREAAMTKSALGRSPTSPRLFSPTSTHHTHTHYSLTSSEIVLFQL